MEFSQSTRGRISVAFIVMLAILLLFVIVIFFPPVHEHKDAATIICKSNLWKIALCFQLYSDEFDNKLPVQDKWCDLIRDYVLDEPLYRCPLDKEGACSYAINRDLPAGFKDVPGDMVVLFESNAGWNQVGGAESVVTGRHVEGGCNVLFGDGRAEFVKAEDLDKLRWKIGSGAD